MSKPKKVECEKAPKMDDLLEQDLALAPSDGALKLVNQLAEKQLVLESEVAGLEEQLELKNKELLKISDDELPSAISQAGLESFTMLSGAKVVVKEDMSVSISAEKRPFVVDWLRENNFGDIVKNEVTVTIPKGTDPKLVQRLRVGIERLKLQYAEAETVNTATVKALLKEQLEKGLIPIELPKFGAYPYKRSKITLPKH